MLKDKLLATSLILMCKISFAQYNSEKQIPFPQTSINKALKNAFEKSSRSENSFQQTPLPQTSSFKGVFNEWNKAQQLQNNIGQKHGNENMNQLIDTIYVGDIPNDTLVITGTWMHNGPIFVFNDGVLIIQNATVTNVGEVYVFQNGKLFADSSSLTFPQQYFYERSLLAVQNGYVHIQNCDFNYSGMSHNLVLGDSAVVELYNIHQNDFTTCGLFGNPTLTIDGCNLAGEYILTANANATFKNVDTLLLWHQFPDSSLVNFTFPPGDTVYSYIFNDTVSGIDGINFNLQVDTCHTVWWAMMPVNGSDVTISNSTVRAIGAWFTMGDTVTITGLMNNSNYTNYVMPVTDRNLHLINSSVQTWSLYVFDSSHINIDSCVVGEVGCQQHSSVYSTDFILDGSGGYFWATDTTFIVADNSNVYSTARSERNGIFILAYSWQPFLPPMAIGQSVMICVQNDLAQDPIPYDGAVAWLSKISQPDTAFTDSVFPVTGSVWIDGGPLGGWMDFSDYSLYYQLAGSGIWNVIVQDSLLEIHNGNLAVWNTYGIAAGNYFLKLVSKNTLGDSIEAIKFITLLLSTVGIDENSSTALSVKVFPNPSDGNFMIEIFSGKNEDAKIEFENALGQTVFVEEMKLKTGKNIIPVHAKKLTAGIYFYRITPGDKTIGGKIVVR